MPDESKELILRVHDECSSFDFYILSKPVIGNGSDVFDAHANLIPPRSAYPVHRMAVLGRALGEVTKYYACVLPPYYIILR